MQEQFRKYGVAVILIGRLTPGLRTPVFLNAGLMRYSFLLFLLIDGLGSLILTPIWVFVGYKFQDSAEAILHNSNLALTCMGALAAIIVFVIYWKKRER